MSLVDPGRPETPISSHRTSRRTVIVSLLLHVGIVAAVVVVPLFGRVALPGLHDMRALAFVRAATLPEVPRAPAAAPTAPAQVQPAAVPSMSPAAARVPLEAPEGIAAEEPPALVPGVAVATGLTAGTLDGVAAGIDGGVPGPPAVAPPPTPPSARPPLRVGGDIRPPRKLRHVAPEYPSLAAQTQTTGTVILEATISTTGEVVNVQVLRSVPLLDRAAVDAVRQWRYEPPLLNGTPVAVLLTVTVRFGR